MSFLLPPPKRKPAGKPPGEKNDVFSKRSQCRKAQVLCVGNVPLSLRTSIPQLGHVRNYKAYGAMSLAALSKISANGQNVLAPDGAGRLLDASGKNARWRSVATPKDWTTATLPTARQIETSGAVDLDWSSPSLRPAIRNITASNKRCSRFSWPGGAGLFRKNALS